MTIKRYLNDSDFERLQNDFGFLLKAVFNSLGELDLALRGTYFNLYFKGNSIAKVIFKPLDKYEVHIHSKFFSGIKLDSDSRFSQQKRGEYVIVQVPKHLLHSFFQQKNLRELCSNVKKANYGEEISFEQMIITDNLSRSDLILIDRQVTDTKLNRKRMDLLGLIQDEEENFHFVVLEVKLGNNPELKNDVAEQIQKYISHIEANFDEYRNCYERYFKQLRQLGLLNNSLFEGINIIQGVKGLVVVGGYSGIAKEQIEKLKKTAPTLMVKQFHYHLDI